MVRVHPDRPAGSAGGRKSGKVRRETEVQSPMGGLGESLRTPIERGVLKNAVGVFENGSRSWGVCGADTRI